VIDSFNPVFLNQQAVEKGDAMSVTVFSNRAVRMLLAGVVVCLVAQPADAGRRSAYSYESQTEARGEVEFEQWATWKTGKDSDSDFDQLDFRHEIEWGVTDRFQLAIYYDWRYRDGLSVEDDGAEFRDVALEAIYNLRDRDANPYGLAIYGETKIGDELFALEGKIIVDKKIGDSLVIYNASIEAEWEGEDYEEDKGVFEQTFAISHEVAHEVFVGIEVLHEVEFDDWSMTGHNVLYVGPNLSFEAESGGGGEWWVTISPLFQVTDVSDEVDFQVRIIFGIEF
jgi:hypothetical protein